MTFIRNKHIWIFFFFPPGPIRLTPAAETTTPALIHPTPTAMVINAPLRRPHHPHLDWVTVPGPSLHWITAKKAITVGITVGNLHLADTLLGVKGRAPQGEQEAPRRAQVVTCLLSTQNKVTKWTDSDTCSGNRSTKSGVRNISTAMSATSTSCLLPSSILIQLLLLSGGTKKQTEITHTSTRNLATESTAGALPGRTTTPLCLSHQATAGPRHRSHRATAAPLCLIRQMTAVPLPPSRPAAVVPLHPSRGHISTGLLRSINGDPSRLQRAVRMQNRS